MLKAIVTVLDENDRIIQANRLIFETDLGTPVGFGIEHDFHFKIVTADEEMIKELTTPSVDEIREMVMGGIQNEQR